MPRNPDEAKLVRVQLGGETYEMPPEVAAQAQQEFGDDESAWHLVQPMKASEFFDDPPPAAARPARPKPRAAGMDLTHDAGAIAAGTVPREGDWVDELAGVPVRDAGEIDPFNVHGGGGAGGSQVDMDDIDALAGAPAPQRPSMAPIDDAMGRDIMHRALGNPSVPTGPAPSSGFPEAWAGALKRPLPPAAPGGGPQPPAPVGGDAMGRDMMHRALGSAVPQGVERLSNNGTGYPDAWANAVNRRPAPTGASSLRPPAAAPDMDLMNDPEALDALAGPSPSAPPGAAPQYDMMVNPSQLELDDIRKRLAGFRIGAQ